MSYIKVENLTKIFGNKVAVDGISFEITQNSIFGILGPNGSGKTTTQRMLTTLMNPTAGSITIGQVKYGRDDIRQLLSGIGYVPQKDALYANLTVWENIDFYFSAYEYKKDRKAWINHIIDLVDLDDHRNTLTKNLSGGMVKRLSIACAIVHQPKIILFDEVTMGLDPVAREKIWNLTRELKKQATIIMTTHYMDEAEELCDSLIILRKGKIIANGSPKNIVKEFGVESLHEVMAGIKDENA